MRRGITSVSKQKAKPAPAKAAPRRTPDDDTRYLLQQWQTPVSQDRLAHLVKHTIRALDRALQMRLARYDVAIGHWFFLRALWREDGITQRQLSRDTGAAEPTTASAMKAMEALGYIERRQRPDNRRNVYVFLTARGRALKDRLVPLALTCNQIAVRGVPEDDVAATRRTLMAMLGNLADDEAAAGGDLRIVSTRERGQRVDAARPKAARRAAKSPARTGREATKSPARVRRPR